MSQSRLEKLGTVYSRTRNLLQTGTLKKEFKPLWYDVYEAFPPKYEPRWDRPVKDCKTVRILYKEDEVRAKFYKNFGDRHEVVNLLDPKFEPLSQTFVRKYQAMEAENDGAKSADELFLATVDALEAEGLSLRSLDPEAAATGKWTQEVEKFKAREERDRVEEQQQDGQPPKISFKELFSKSTLAPSDKVE